MKKETIEYLCDTCGKPATHKDGKVQVIFTTEQTEGRSTGRYLSSENIDLCDPCMEKLLRGSYIFGSGAQGNNEYWFKESKNQ